jgi:hypothetical protein
MISFYDLTEDERIALTDTVIENGTTLKARWDRLRDAEANPWSRRAERAGELLGPVETLLDVGCGTMALERFVQAKTYIPSDVTRRDDRTIVMDYNVEGAPGVEVDAVAVLGVLEYLHDPLSFMRGLNARRAVVSYCVTDAPEPLEPRKAHAWVNSFAMSDMSDLLKSAGWTIDCIEVLDSIQSIWLAHRD